MAKKYCPECNKHPKRCTCIAPEWDEDEYLDSIMEDEEFDMEDEEDED